MFNFVSPDDKWDGMGEGDRLTLFNVHAQQTKGDTPNLVYYWYVCGGRLVKDYLVLGQYLLLEYHVGCIA